MDIVQAVGNLIAGADDKTVRTLAQVVVDRYSKLMGEAYILAPASQTFTQTPSGSAPAKAGGGVKKSNRWSRLITACDYTKRANGYAVKGGFANRDLSQHADGSLVLMVVPDIGMMLGTVCKGEEWVYQYPSGQTGSVENFKGIMPLFNEGDWAGIVDRCKAMGVPQS